MTVLEMSFKWLGLVAMILLWSGLIFLLHKWPGKKSMSLSLHAAQTKSSQVYYFFLFVIVLPLLYLFLVTWYVPTVGLSGIFTFLATIAFLGQLTAVIFPAVPGWRIRVHNYGAFLMTLLMLPISLLIAFGQVSKLIQVLTVVGVCYLIGATILYVAVKRTHAYTLYFQIAHIAVFFGIILLSAYIR